VGTGGATGGVTSEGFHDIQLVVVGEAGVGRHRREAHLAGGCGRHDDGFALGSLENWFWCRRWGEVVVSCLGGRHCESASLSTRCLIVGGVLIATSIGS